MSNQSDKKSKQLPEIKNEQELFDFFHSLPAEMQLKLEARYSRISPFPPPEEMKQFEELYPGFTKIVAEAFRNQVNGRLTNEAKIVEADIKTSARGQIFAFILSVLILAAGIVFIVMGKDIKGFVLVLSSLVAVSSLFITGKKKQEESRPENKNGLQ